MKNIVVVDYGIGNVDSVVRALEFCGAEAVLSNDPADFKKSDGIVLPGVGSFDDGMKRLRRKGLVEILNSHVLKDKKPFLGICLGMQLLATRGHEGKGDKGLGWIDGQVCRLKAVCHSQRIPHMGWNEVTWENKSSLCDGIKDKTDFYFVHSYHFICDRREDVLGITPYCGNFISAVIKDNIIGVQFHPEKSQKKGQHLLKNFLEMV